MIDENSIKEVIFDCIGESDLDASIDSINLVEWIITIEDKFDITIPDEKLIDLIGVSVGVFYDHMTTMVFNLKNDRS